VAEIITRKTRWVTVKFDGRLFHVTNSAIQSKREDALEMQAIFEELGGDKQYPVFVDARNSKNAPTEDANEIFRSQEYCRHIEFMVVLLEGRLVANAARVYSSFIEMPIDISYFSTEREAADEIVRRNPACRDSSLIVQTKVANKFAVIFDQSAHVATVALQRRNESWQELHQGISREIDIITATQAETLKLFIKSESSSMALLNAVSRLATHPIEAIAIVSSPIARLIGNLWFRSGVAKVPVKFFQTEEMAQSWLSRAGILRGSSNNKKQGITSELYLLTEAFERFSKGDFSEISVNELQANVKLRLFTNALNVVASKVKHQIVALESANQVLETRVQVRTRELEDQRARAVEQARMVAVGRFASGLAHEVNNPLAVISSAARILLRKSEMGTIAPEDLVGKLQSIMTMVERATQIVRSVKNISRDSSDDPMYKESISDVVKETFPMIEVSLRELQVKVDLHVDGEVQALCRRSEIGQVLINLLNNARDAVEKLPLGERWIKLRVFSRNECAVISVANGGPAIPADIRGKLMDPFFTTKPVGKGTGLGLSLSHAIARLHGGSLQLLPQEVTCFELELPMSQKNMAVV
jgi:signal transduction histidine kinase